MKHLLLFSLLLTVGWASAQSPGGVSTSLGWWYKGDAGVTTSGMAVTQWNDQSPTALNVTQATASYQPTNGNYQNFNKVMTFDGSDALANAAGYWKSTTANTGYNVFAVAKHTNGTGSVNALFSEQTSASNQTIFDEYGGNIYTGFYASNYAYTPAAASGVPQLITSRYNSVSSVKQLSLNGKAQTMTAGGGIPTFNGSNSPLVLGNYSLNQISWPLNGDIAEILMYSSDLTTLQRQYVESYLAVKWGLTIDQTSPQNYLNSANTTIWNGITNSVYKNNIAGIAKDIASGLDQEISTSVTNTGTNPVITSAATGVFPATNASATSNLIDGQALIAGSNGLTGNVLNGNFTANHIDSLSKTVWKVQNTGSVGNVSVGVLASYSPKPYALLVSSDATFPAGSTTVYTLSANGNYLSASNVALADGMYFTFGYNANFSVYFSTTPVSAVGSIDGTATLNISGGISPYTIAWSNSAATAAITGLAAGRYTATITDNNGAILKRTVEITTPYSRWAWGYNGYGQLGNGNTIEKHNPTFVGSPTDKWISLSSYYVTSFGIKSDGSLWGWGYNGNGIVGDGTTTQRYIPSAVSIGSTWQTVTTGYYHTLGIKTDGTLWAWGYNGYGQLGIGNTTEKHSPVQVGTDKWIAVAAGGYHTLAIRADGTLWAWGLNNYNQLGTGNTTNQYSPVQIVDTSNNVSTKWVSVTGGDAYSLALRSDGTIWGWGYNGYGNLGTGNNTQQTKPTQEITKATNWATVKSATMAGDMVAATKTTGTAWAWGYNGNGEFGNGATNGGATSTPVQTGALTNWYNVVPGNYHTLGVKTDASIQSWGYNANGELGDGTTTQKTSPAALNFSLYAPNPNTWGAIAAGYQFSLGLSSLPNAPIPVISTTAGDTAYTNPIPVTVNFTEAVTGFVAGDVVVTTNSGTAPISGFVKINDSTYTFYITPSTSGIKATISIAAGVATGTHTTLANIIADPLDITYFDGLKVLYTVTPVTATTAAGVVSANGGAAITISGGFAPYTQVWSNSITTSISTATAISSKAAGFYTVTVTDYVGNIQTRVIEIPTVGSLWAWGYNGYGELGNGTNTSKIKPTYVGSAGTFIALSAMNATSAGIRSDGTLWMWGYNGLAEQGNGTYNWSTAPVQVGTGTTWRAVSSGYFHTMAIKTDGTLWGWGYNGYGELGDGTNTLKTTPVQIGTDKWIAISASYIHTIGIKSDGTLWSWGYNGNGQSGYGTYAWSNVPVQIGTSNQWTQASTGSYYSVAIKADSSSWSFGYNGYGNLGDGTYTQSNSPVQFGSASSNWLAISPSGYGSANATNAIAPDGSMWNTGYNGYGQFGNGVTSVFTNSPVQVSGSSSYVAVQGNAYTTLARKSDATLWAWGYGGNGQVGDGTYTTRTSPVQVMRPAGLTGNATNWAGFASAYYHSMALAPIPSNPIPDISSIYSDTTSNTTIPVTVTFSEGVNGFTVGDISITNGTIVGGSFAAVNTSVYTINIVPLAGTTGGSFNHILLNIAANQATSTATGFQNLAADQFDIVYYNPPTVLGPGGVANPTAWFKADASVYSDSGVTPIVDGVAVKQWSNSGVATIHLASVFSDSTASAPTFKANDINFNPGLTFNGTNFTTLSKIGRINTNDLFGTSAYSHFSVMKRGSSGSVIWNFAKNLSSPSGNKTGFEQSSSTSFTTYHNSSSVNADAGNQWHSNANPFATTDGTWLGDAVFSGSNTLANNVNTLNISPTSLGTIAALPTIMNNDFRIGNSSSNTNAFSGEIPEIVIYNSALSTTDQDRVRTYMAIKYGSTLGSITTPYAYINSALTNIWPTSATYQNDVAGIERDDNGSIYQKQSQSVNSGNGIQPIIGIGNISTSNILNTNTMSDASAEVWGNDNGSTTIATPLTGIGSLTLRMARVWKLVETGTVGTVRVAIPSSIFASFGCKAMIVSASNTFTSGNTAYYSRGTQTINGVLCETFDLDFPSSATNYFTFATTISNTPALVLTGTAKTTLFMGCSTDSVGNMQFVDAGNAALKYLVINPGTNTGYNFTVTPSNNFPTVGNQVITSGTTNTTALSNRMFTIADAGANSYPSGMTVRIYYSPSDTIAAAASLSVAVTSLPTSRWFKYSGNVAQVLAAQTATGITGATYLTPAASGMENGVSYVEFYPITSFSTFGYLAAKTAVVLPVAITSFTATANLCSATLNWATATESNSKYYDVEAGSDGSTFNKVGEVKSKNSLTGASYSYIDNGLTNGITYFRLKAVDNDGKFTYSQIVTVITNCNSSSLSVSPNPASNLVKVQGMLAGSRMQLFDANGKKLTEFTAISTNQTINVSMYANGVYILRVQATDGSVSNVKIVKQ